MGKHLSSALCFSEGPKPVGNAVCTEKVEE